MSVDEILALFDKKDYQYATENNIVFKPGVIQLAYLPVLDGVLTFHHRRLMHIELRLRHDKGAPTEAIFHHDAKKIGQLFGMGQSIKGSAIYKYKFHAWIGDFYKLHFSLPLEHWDGLKDRMYLSIEPIKTKYGKILKDKAEAGFCEIMN